MKSVEAVKQGLPLCSILRPWRVLAAQAGPRARFFTLPALFTRERASCSLRPWREKSLSRSVLMRDGTGRMRGYSLGFTLIEILVVVLIIGILGAIMLPQYQRAVLKSRFSGMMPIAKALAESNEVYYLDHGEYAENPADLLVAGRDKNAGAYPDGTKIVMYSDTEDLSFVRSENDNIPTARYVVYQKHSKNFPDTTWCEAKDTHAEEMCQALGGQFVAGGSSSGGTSEDNNWKAYLLSGTARTGDTFAAAGGSGSGSSGGAATPARVLSADPECTNYSTYSKCVYTYESGETLAMETWPNKTPRWACSSVTGNCYDMSWEDSASGETTYQTTFNIDPDTQIRTLFNSENQFGVTVKKGNLLLTYDPVGNLIGGERRPAPNEYIYYDSEGNVVSTTINGKSNYNPTGIPSLSQEELTTSAALAQPYLGKNKCTLYPELQECPHS